MLFPPSSRTRKEQGKTRNEQGMNKERERNEQETTRKEQGMIKERTRNEQDRTRKEQERTRKEQGMNHGMFLFHDDFNGFFGQQTSQLWCLGWETVISFWISSTTWSQMLANLPPWEQRLGATKTSSETTSSRMVGVVELLRVQNCSLSNVQRVGGWNVFFCSWPLYLTCTTSCQYSINESWIHRKLMLTLRKQRPVFFLTSW